MIQALREILAVFKVDNTSLKKGIGEGNKLVDGLKDALGSITGPLAAALTGGAIVGFTHELLEAADAASKTADAFGLAIVEWQGLEHAADMSGVASEMLAASFGKLQHGLAEAKKGTGPAAEAVKALGLQLEDAEGKAKTTGVVLGDIADAIQGMDADARNAQLMKLFGEQGAKLVPLLKGGSAGLREMRKEVEELGFAFDDQFAAGAEEFNDNLTRLKRSGQGFLLQVIGPLMPALVDLSQELVRGAKVALPMVRSFIDFVRHSKLLEAALVMLTGKGLLAGVGAIGKWAKAAGGLTGILKTFLGTLLRVIAPLLILEDVFVFLAGGKSALGRTLDKAFGEGTADKVRDLIGQVGDFLKLFKTAPDDVRKAFSTLADDIAKMFGTTASDLDRTFFKFIVDSFLFTVDVLTGGWDNFANKFKAVGDWLLASIGIVWTEMKFAGLGVAAALSDAFATAWNAIIDGARVAMRTVAGLVEGLPLIGPKAAEGLKGLADGVGGAKMGTDASEVVAKQLSDARLAIVADLESAQSRMVQPSQTSNVVNNNDWREEINVNVNIPAGASAADVAKIKKDAYEAAKHGVKAAINGRRVTQDALVPRPAG